MTQRFHLFWSLKVDLAVLREAKSPGVLSCQGTVGGLGKSNHHVFQPFYTRKDIGFGPRSSVSSAALGEQEIPGMLARDLVSTRPARICEMQARSYTGVRLSGAGDGATHSYFGQMSSHFARMQSPFDVESFTQSHSRLKRRG